MSERPDSLRVYYDDRIVFSVDGRWLHPLFALEEHLAENKYDKARLRVHDTVVGKAAAMMLVRMGVRAVHAGIMSTLAEAVFMSSGVSYGADEVVERIDCRTEHILKDVEDPEQAHAILKARAGGRRTA